MGRKRTKKETGRKVQERKWKESAEEKKKKWAKKESGRLGHQKKAEAEMKRAKQILYKEKKRGMEKRSKLSFPQAKFWCFP